MGLGLNGCIWGKPVIPPNRPVAYLVPTVYSAKIIDSCQPCLVNDQNIRESLDSLHVLELLRECGLQDLDLAVAARGISSRGYAEIDGRRSKGAVRWVVFFSLKQSSFTATVAFLDLPPAACLRNIRPAVQVPFKEERWVKTAAGAQLINVDGWRDGVICLYRINRPDGAVSHWELTGEFPVLEK